MRCIRVALSVLTTLLNPFAMMILGAVITAVAIPGPEPVPSDRLVAARSGRAALRDDGVTAHVAFEAAQEDAPTKLVVHNAAGDEIGKLVMYHDDSMTFEPGGTAPVGFVVHRDRFQALHVGVGLSQSSFELRANPDGSADLRVTDLLKKPLYDVQVTKEGNVQTRRDGFAY